MSFRVIKGKKIKDQRGRRTLREIADLSKGKFTYAALSMWEGEICKPSDENVPVLLQALNCAYEDISEPVDLKTALIAA